MKNILTRLLLAGVALAASACNTEIRIPFDPSVRDYTPVVSEVLSAHPHGHFKLVFEQGAYPFFPEEAVEKYLSVSNNDNGLKRVAFNLDSMEDVSVCGDGTTFLFHGGMVPFALTESSEISLEGFEIDWEDHFTLEGKVLSTDPQTRSFVLRIRDDNPYRISGDTLYFRGYDWEKCLGENIVFDPETRRPCYFTEKCQHWTAYQLKARELSSGVVEFSGIMSADLPPVGGVWVDKGLHGSNRECPAIVISDSRGITLSDVAVRHCGAMALIAQYSSDITLERYSTAQKEGCTRMVTASADATHFVDCSGKVELRDCDFESMLDDATNIHGTYMLVKDVLPDGRFEACFGHFQQEGNHFADAGETIRFVDKTSLRPVGEAVVKAIERTNENDYVIASDFDWSGIGNPAQIAVENVSRGTSEILISGCRVDLNRARSLLLSCHGKVTVENCEFRSMMAGIRICGDANYWFESGQTDDITIRGCRFTDLGIGGGAPQAILQIDPIIPSESRGNDFFFHRSIVFENNIVETFDCQVVYALSVENLVIRGNKFIDSKSYAPIWPGLALIDAQFCGNVTISGNDFSLWPDDAYVSIHNCDGVILDGCDLPVEDSPNPYFFQS